MAAVREAGRAKRDLGPEARISWLERQVPFLFLRFPRLLREPPLMDAFSAPICDICGFSLSG
jgi:hypothetical protein